MAQDSQAPTPGRSGLSGIRVLEVAGGVGVAWAAKLLGDLGADVVRYETADDLVRSRPHQLHRWLNTNKRSVTDGLGDLAASADIVFHSMRTAEAAAAGLDYAALAARAPAVVVCSITPFGMTGPYADYAAEELTIIHGCSWGNLTPSASKRADLPPIKAFGHHATLQTSTVAAAAALAAFDRAERTGLGDHVDFSLFAAGAKMTETAPASASFQGEDSSRLGVKSVVPWGIYQCRDGLIQFVCVEEAQWQSFVRLMGTPEWATMDVLGTVALRRENSDLVELYVSEWMSEQSAAELYLSGQAARLCVSPVYTMAELDRDAQLAARNFFAETPDGLRLLGPGYRTDQDWWALRRSAPALGEHTGQTWLDAGRDAIINVEGAGPGGGGGRPLDGVRVCDFTWIWAGPMCTQYLAHLGAEVVRLESPDHLCLFRRLPFNPPDMALGPDTTGLFQLYNSDKRSLAIDIAHPASRAAINTLIAWADVVIDNFAVGTMAKLGFGVDDVRAINPNAIVVSLSGYGQTGPSADFMAYGPAGGAVAGLYSATGYEDGPAAETGVAVGDPATGITAAFATVASLVARRRTGAAARVDVAMVEAIAATVGEAWMVYATEGHEPARLGNHDPQWAPHACYPTIAEDRWVSIAVTNEAQWQALCAVIDPTLADDARFATAAGRKANEAALDELIGAWTASREGWAVTEALQAVGVAAFPSLTPLELWTANPQLTALGMLERPDHAVTGTRQVPGIPWRLTNGANGLRRAAPALGQHTDEVLSTVVGLSPAEIDELAAAGALPGRSLATTD